MSEQAKTVVINAAALAATLQAVASLVQEVEAIRAQVEANAQAVWDEVRTDYLASADAFAQAREVSGHYHDARARGAEAPATAVEPAPAPGEGEAHGTVTGA